MAFMVAMVTVVRPTKLFGLDSKPTSIVGLLNFRGRGKVHVLEINPEWKDLDGFDIN